MQMYQELLLITRENTPQLSQTHSKYNSVLINKKTTSFNNTLNFLHFIYFKLSKHPDTAIVKRFILVIILIRFKDNHFNETLLRESDKKCNV